MKSLPPIAIAKATLRFDYGRIPNGHEALYALTENLCAPVGFIWYRQILIGHVDMLYVFVHERCRRQGIATRMLNQLRCWYPQATTCTALANEQSQPWLVAAKFKQKPAGWFLLPKS